MTPGSIRACRWACLLFIISSSYGSINAQTIIGHGLTNKALGNAILHSSGDWFDVDNVGSNGLDGVSTFLGEPEGGISFAPYVPELADGQFMSLNVFGRLNNTNDVFLGRVWGGRANQAVYPLSLDFSPLAPESVTYQIFSNNELQKEFSRGQPIVVVNLFSYYSPRVNPLERQRDGTLGANITLSQQADFVFPEFLKSARGDRLFIRVNNPTNQPSTVTRVDTYGGGGMPRFNFSDVALGAFYRPHRARNGATMHAAPGSLGLANLSSTNDTPVLTIDLENVGGMKLEFEPFALTASNAFMSIGAVGNFSGFLGSVDFRHQDGRLSMAFQHWGLPDVQLLLLTNGVVVHQQSSSTSNAIVQVDTNALIQALTVHAKTAEALPGLHVKFLQATAVTVSSNGPPQLADEVRFLLPPPIRMENLNVAYLNINHSAPITITNEVATPPQPIPRLYIERFGTNVALSWLDPNEAYILEQSYFVPPPNSYYYFQQPDDYEVFFSDPYRKYVAPIITTNNAQLFRLVYRPF